MSLTELITGHTSYATVDEADLYFSAQLNADVWEESDSTEKRKALTQATKVIDLLRYRSYKTVASQTNEFPRGGSSTIPQRIVEATSEIARALIDGVDPELLYENVSLLSTGYQNIRTNYKERTEEYKISGIPSVVAYRLIRPYIADPKEIKLT